MSACVRFRTIRIHPRSACTCWRPRAVRCALRGRRFDAGGLKAGRAQPPDAAGATNSSRCRGKRGRAGRRENAERVIAIHGNRAIFGGSYGWASSGRFHHALSQIHRFLNTIGGYTRSVDTLSSGAARVLMRHIVAPMEELMATHTSWPVLVEHTQLFVALGGVPLKNAQITAGGPGRHTVRPMLSCGNSYTA